MWDPSAHQNRKCSAHFREPSRHVSEKGLVDEDHVYGNDAIDRLNLPASSVDRRVHEGVCAYDKDQVQQK